MPISSDYFVVPSEFLIGVITDLRDEDTDYGPKIILEVMPLGEENPRFKRFNRDTARKRKSDWQKMLKKFPQTIFIGHGPHFWAEIAADLSKKDFQGYPKGKVKRGALDKLFSKYHNLYGDLSAGSGQIMSRHHPGWSGPHHHDIDR